MRLRTTADSRRLDAWTLALRAKGVEPLFGWSGSAFELHVARGWARVASAELDAADAEEAEALRLLKAVREHRPATRHGALGALFIAVLLLGFHALTGPRMDGGAWFSAGASDAERVLHGEWWRTVTALTLHADSAHVMSNVALGTIAITAVMRSQGVGFGAALVLASGALGNFANAWLHQAHHSSVGFSTAVFGAIGILGGLSCVWGRRRATSRRPVWSALGASLALLALLGAGERSDVFAHLLGGVAGLALGLLAGWSELRPKTRVGQYVAGLGTALTVVGAWIMASA